MKTDGAVPEFSQRIGSLDGLRGVAIVLVILAHWVIFPFRPQIQELSPALYALLQQAMHGVDIFFVVSGFLIGRLLLANADRPGLLKAFYARRFFRIIPLYFAVIGLFLWGRTAFGGYPDGAAPLGAFFLFTNNFSDLFGWHVISEFGPYWSLAIEEQFYFASALVVAAFGRKGAIFLALAFVFCSVGGRILWYFAFAPIDWWRFTLTHADPIGIGLLAAVVVTSPRLSTRLMGHIGWLRLAGMVSLAGFVAASWFGVTGKLGLDVTLLSVAVACWILLKFLAEPKSVLAFAPLQRVGEMCFSLYILHQGWNLYAQAILANSGLPPGALLLVSFGLLLVVSRLLWVFVETPLIGFAKQWRYDAAKGGPVSPSAAVPVAGPAPHV